MPDATDSDPCFVNVCSCGSSGSTILARSLDRHPSIACGDEMFLFSTPLLYDNYQRYRKWARAGYHFGISANPYHQGRALFRNAHAYGLSRKTLLKWSQHAETFPAFVTQVKNHVTQHTGKKLWAEKTPRNLRTIGKFIQTFPNARVIHIVRDPRDVITSLIGRNKPVVNNIESWLGAVSTIQPHLESDQILEVRYEDLCNSPEETMKSVFNFLNVSENTDCIFSDKDESKQLVKMKEHKSWKSSPSEQFSAKSIGRHKEQDLPWESIMSYRLTKDYAKLLGTHQWSLGELAEKYGYDVPTAKIPETYRPANLKWKLGWIRRYFDQQIKTKNYIPMIEGPPL